MPTPAERKALSVAMQALGRQLVAEGIVGSNFWQCQRAGAAAINSALTAPLSSGKIDTLAAKMVKTLLPELPGMLSTLFQFASPPVTAVGPLGTVVLPGGGGGGDPILGGPVELGSYVGDGASGRIISTGLGSITRVYIINAAVVAWWSDGFTTLDSGGFSGMWTSSVLIPFSGSDFTVNTGGGVGNNNLGVTYRYLAWT